jgi:ketosteroid isomerase-like protein
VQAQEFFDADARVAVIMRMQGRTHDLEVDETWSSLSTIRNGRIVRIQGFTSRNGALEAAGLQE